MTRRVAVTPFEPAGVRSQVIKELLRLLPLVRVGQQDAEPLGKRALRSNLVRIQMLAPARSVRLVYNPVLRVRPQQRPLRYAALRAQSAWELVGRQVVEEGARHRKIEHRFWSLV